MRPAPPNGADKTSVFTSWHWVPGKPGPKSPFSRHERFLIFLVFGAGPPAGTALRLAVQFSTPPRGESERQRRQSDSKRRVWDPKFAWWITKTPVKD